MTNRDGSDSADLAQLIQCAEAAGFERGVRSLAHALGTPLNVVSGYAELLAENADASPKVVSVLRKKAEEMTAALRQSVAFAARIADPNERGDNAAAAFDALLVMLRASKPDCKIQAVGSDSNFALPVTRDAFLVIGNGIVFGALLWGDEQQLTIELQPKDHGVQLQATVAHRKDPPSLAEARDPWLAGYSPRGEHLALAAALGVLQRARGELQIRRVGANQLWTATLPGAA